MTGLLLVMSSGLYATDKEKSTLPVLSVKTSISLSDSAGNAAVYDSVQSVALEFSAPLNPKTVPGEIKLYKVTAQGEQEVPSIITIDNKSPSILTLSRKNKAFTEGDGYKITISDKVKSTGGISLNKEFVGYFVVNYPFTLDGKGVAGLDNKRNVIVIVSDIHLGANDSYTECKKNRDVLVHFLKDINRAPNVRELVIAGDLLDLWFIPATTDTFNGKTQREFVKGLAANNKAVISAFNTIIQAGKIKVTYVPGNHDLLVTQEDIQTILPGIHQARDVKGLGKYSPDGHPEIIIEHGHRYNFFCAPDPISNKSTAPGSILPPGYFFTRIATTSVVEGHPRAGGPMPTITANTFGESQTLAFIYWNVWKELMTQLPIKEGFDEKIIKTNIDGFTNTYSISDLMPYQLSEGGFIDLTLFKGIQDTWDERQTLNEVAVKIPPRDAIANAALAGEMDAQAVVQYFGNRNSEKRIVVFGHTHEARVIPSKNHRRQKTIYANSGTWIDKNKFPTMTFIVITPQTNNTSLFSYVNLYQYSPSGTIVKMDSQALISKGE